MLRFSANLSLLFTELSLPKRIAAAKRCGFDAVEIQFPYEMAAEALRDALEAVGAKLILFNVLAGDLMQGGEGLATSAKKRDEFQRAVELAFAYAEVLKPLCVNVLPGRALDERRRGECLETFYENLRFAAEAFSVLDLKTVFEAVNTRDMPGFLIHGGEQMLEVLGTVNHPNLFMQYDIYHMVAMGENPAEFIPAHDCKIGHIQFADAPGRGPPGTGAIDFERLFAEIDACAYGGWLGAEYKPVGATEESLAWFEKAGVGRPRRAVCPACFDKDARHPQEAPAETSGSA